MTLLTAWLSLVPLGVRDPGQRHASEPGDHPALRRAPPKDVAEGNPDAFRVVSASPSLTSLDNMNPLRPFIRSLAQIPVVPGVHVHSIIAVKGTGPLEKEDDGVVAYRSACVDGAESTLIVHSGHSVRETPEGIEEVLRILTLHASTQEDRNAK
jgi:hypothetical protein